MTKKVVGDTMFRALAELIKFDGRDMGQATTGGFDNKRSYSHFTEFWKPVFEYGLGESTYIANH
jgi:hypothetical protein